MFRFEVIVSGVSGESVYALLRFMGLQTLEGLFVYEMVLRRCFHVICCSYRISSDISLFNVFMRLMVSGVGRWCLRWFLVRILCLIILLNPAQNCLVVPVGIYYLPLCVIAVSNSFMTASMLV